MLCTHCYEQFTPKHKLGKYCSRKCYRSAKCKRHLLKNGGKQKRAEQNCNKCNKIFIPTRHIQKYCSISCGAEARRKFLNIPDCLAEAHRLIDKNIDMLESMRQCTERLIHEVMCMNIV